MLGFPGRADSALHPATMPDGAGAPEIVGLLAAWRAGDRAAKERLASRVYDALHELTARHLRRERDGHALAPTALVREAWGGLVDPLHAAPRDRVHFCALASRVLRRVLVDLARRTLAAPPEASGPALQVAPAADAPPVDDWALTVLGLDDALVQLGLVDARLPRVVECRFFGGLDEAETAEVLGVSDRTVHRDWLRARAWLELRLHE
ncbi:ECF-type sigma factor [Roseisolibacter agri]|uniref:DNA-directed RNA polymerase sigma-70 factor n=1 Tax=Roseisolibacter agri TaxID=2014610 RepID=A0AA37V4U5_9BACT|nr:ECF-type sigma factor [Roseisolibacter agri]GLC28377.1 DNA-directed RNA polymerase sigma-70 factor [Roseisolibacter agri]